MNEDNTQEEIEEAIDKANYFKDDLTTKQENSIWKMKRNQWFVLAFSFMMIGIMFIGLDLIANRCLNFVMNNIEQSYAHVVSSTYCLIESAMFEPFIYLSFALVLVFMILGFMEKKNG